MNGTEHLITSTIFFILIWLLVPVIHVTEIIFAIFLSICPDIDLKFKERLGHRSIWTHSIIIPLIIFIFNPLTMTALFVMSFGLHCLCDIRIKKVGGTYTVKVLKVFNKTIGLNYERSTAWLIGNFIGSLILLIGWCLI